MVGCTESVGKKKKVQSKYTQIFFNWHLNCVKPSIVDQLHRIICIYEVCDFNLPTLNYTERIELPPIICTCHIFNGWHGTLLVYFYLCNFLHGSHLSFKATIFYLFQPTIFSLIFNLYYFLGGVGLICRRRGEKVGLVFRLKKKIKMEVREEEEMGWVKIKVQRVDL